MKPSQPIIIDSWIPGPIVTILGGIHGNEICGIEAIDSIKNTLVLKKGKLFLLYGNVEAIEKNVRQIDCNLNRMFRDDSQLQNTEKETIEYCRSREIIPYLNLSDASLDLHSSPTQGSPAFIICEKNGAEIVKDFPFAFRCYGFSEIEPGGTDEYMNSRGKIGICIECGSHTAPDAKEKALLSIQKFLTYFDMIEVDSTTHESQKQEIFIAVHAYITRTNEFRVSQSFRDFENIERWQLIWYDGWEIVSAKKHRKNPLCKRSKSNWCWGFYRNTTTIKCSSNSSHLGGISLFLIGGYFSDLYFSKICHRESRGRFFYSKM
jgi:succinylglutamate desuccinylase